MFMVVISFGLGSTLTSSLHLLGLVANALVFSGSFCLLSNVTARALARALTLVYIILPGGATAAAFPYAPGRSLGVRGVDRMPMGYVITASVGLDGSGYVFTRLRTYGLWAGGYGWDKLKQG